MNKFNLSFLKDIFVKYLLPDEHYSKILEINFDDLHQQGYRALFLDIDNTLVERKYVFPEWKMKKLIDELKLKKWTILMISNNRRVTRALKVADFLEIPCIYNSIKPFSWVYKKAFKDFRCEPENTICIGDQLFMDILGGNIVGCKTIYVAPLGAEPNPFRAMYIWFERTMFKLLSKLI